MSDIKSRFVDWSIGSIVGNIVWAAASAVALYLLNERTGCVGIVIDSMRGHEVELAAWTVASFAFGAVVGFVIRHRIAIRQLATKDDEARKAIEDHTASFLNLQAKQLSAIGYCIKGGGTTSIPSESELARELQSLKRMGYADTVDGSPYSSYWFVTDKAMSPLQNSDECWNLLSEAMKAGRFDVWGRYVETPPEVREALLRDTDER